MEIGGDRRSFPEAGEIGVWILSVREKICYGDAPSNWIQVGLDMAEPPAFGIPASRELSANRGVGEEGDGIFRKARGMRDFKPPSAQKHFLVDGIYASGTQHSEPEDFMHPSSNGRGHSEDNPFRCLYCAMMRIPSSIR